MLLIAIIGFIVIPFLQSRQNEDIRQQEQHTISVLAANGFPEHVVFVHGSSAEINIQGCDPMHVAVDGEKVILKPKDTSGKVSPIVVDDGKAIVSLVDNASLLGYKPCDPPNFP